MAETLLSVHALGRRFGGVRALDGVAFSVAPGELVGLIGPNGSGKTTAFNLITGVVRPSGGRILFRGHDVTTSTPQKNARLGMARTFQNIRLFRDLPVIDNVAVGLHMRHGPGLLPTILTLPRARAAEAEIRRKAEEVIAILGLAGRAQEPVGRLPYGEQRKVEFARALATEPTLLLLDEPSAGMTPSEKAELGATIARLNAELGIAILLIEHDMAMVMGICARLVVMNEGKVLAAGPPDAVRRDGRVIEAYLGHRAADAAA